jgi:hypothetical protein
VRGVSDFNPPILQPPFSTSSYTQSKQRGFLSRHQLDTSPEKNFEIAVFYLTPSLQFVLVHNQRKLIFKNCDSAAEYILEFLPNFQIFSLHLSSNDFEYLFPCLVRGLNKYLSKRFNFQDLNEVFNFTQVEKRTIAFSISLRQFRNEAERVYFFKDASLLLPVPQSLLRHLFFDCSQSLLEDEKRALFDPTGLEHATVICSEIFTLLTLLQEKVLTHFNVNPLKSTTLPSLSKILFLRSTKNLNNLQLPLLDSTTDTFVRAAYRGGRCEVFNNDLNVTTQAHIMF